MGQGLRLTAPCRHLYQPPAAHSARPGQAGALFRAANAAAVCVQPAAPAAACPGRCASGAFSVARSAPPGSSCIAPQGSPPPEPPTPPGPPSPSGILIHFGGRGTVAAAVPAAGAIPAPPPRKRPVRPSHVGGRVGYARACAGGGAVLSARRPRRAKGRASAKVLPPCGFEGLRLRLRAAACGVAPRGSCAPRRLAARRFLAADAPARPRA